MNISYYISSHGYGHFARTYPVLNKLSEFHNIYFNTDLPLNLINKSLNKKIKIFSKSFDAGCIQKNFIEIDISKTLKAAEKKYYENQQKIKEESEFLKSNNIDLIICDAPSFPIKLGYLNKIKTIVMTNFTWYDIYSKFPRKYQEKYKTLIDSIKKEYSYADLQIIPQVGIANNYIKNKKQIGFIGNKGKNILEKLKFKNNKKLVFIYLGDYGSDFFKWKNLKKIEDYIFITKDKNSFKTEDNLINLKDTDFLHKDLIASSDIVLMKLGYSTLATVLIHKKNILFCDRKNFAEFNEMKSFVELNEIGLKIPDKDFYDCNWEKYINMISEKKYNDSLKINNDGIENLIKIINEQ